MTDCEIAVNDVDFLLNLVILLMYAYVNTLEAREEKAILAVLRIIKLKCILKCVHLLCV